jgi:cytochrome P450
MLDDEWYAKRFDHLSPELTASLYESLAHMRGRHPVAWSEERGGFWAVTKYVDVLRVAQDWETFSSAHGVTVPAHPAPIPSLPEQLDPPLHREYKRLINAYFTPAVVLEHHDATTELVNRLIDGFIGDGRCDFMSSFARPLPGLVFFDMLHAPAEELAEINRLASLASNPTTREAMDARGEMLRWIAAFAEERRNCPPRGDVVDAILAAEIEGRPITETEIVGVIQLLLFGGLDTTAGALGMMMIRFCQEPAIPELLRDNPDLITDAVEELLRLDGPFVFIGRTAMRDTEIGGCPVRQGDRVLISWVSANRDEDEFPDAAAFDLERSSNRHIAFGAGPHRCAGSNLARMNLRIAVTELLRRLRDIRLDVPVDSIPFHSGYSRAPEVLPIAFTAAVERPSTVA